MLMIGNKIDLPNISTSRHLDRSFRVDSAQIYGDDDSSNSAHSYLKDSKGFKMSNNSFMIMKGSIDNSVKRKIILKRLDA